MRSTVRVTLRRCLWLMAGAVLLTGLTTSTVPAPAGATPQPPPPAASAQPASLPSADFALDASRQPPTDPNGAFLRSRNGRFTPLGGIPGAAVASHLNVNNRGQVVGGYVDAQGAVRAFVKDRRGRLTTFAVPGAATTIAAGINDRGQVAGTYYDTLLPPPRPPGTVHGFVRQPDGQITTIDLPAHAFTAVTDINNRGQLAGQTDDAAGRAIGFVRDPNGRVTTITIPGREVGDILALNDRGQVVGEAAVPPMRSTATPRSSPATALSGTRAASPSSTSPGRWPPSRTASTTPARSPAPTPMPPADGTGSCCGGAATPPSTCQAAPRPRRPGASTTSARSSCRSWELVWDRWQR